MCGTTIWLRIFIEIIGSKIKRNWNIWIYLYMYHSTPIYLSNKLDNSCFDLLKFNLLEDRVWSNPLRIVTKSVIPGTFRIAITRKACLGFKAWTFVSIMQNVLIYWYNFTFFLFSISTYSLAGSWGVNFSTPDSIQSIMPNKICGNKDLASIVFSSQE